MLSGVEHKNVNNLGALTGQITSKFDKELISPIDLFFNEIKVMQEQ